MGRESKASKREKLKDMFSVARDVLKHICEDCGLRFNKEFPEFLDLSIDDMSDSKLLEYTSNIREIAKYLIETFIMSHWIDVAKEAYDPAIFADVERDLKMMVFKGAIEFYDYCSYSFKILERLNKKDPKENKKVLSEITKAAEEESFETTVNKHSLITRSIYEHEIFDAIQEGVRHSSHAKAYVSARRGKNSISNPASLGE